MKPIIRILSGDLLSLLFRLFVGVVFVYASFYKIVEPEQFARSITYYKATPLGFVNLMAIVIPWLELFTGILLILGVLSRSSALIIGTMLLIFIAAISQALLRDIDISCGCFRSEGGERIGLGLLIRDIIWFLMCVHIMRFDTGRFSISRFFKSQTR
jgi:putative oxidoreductase